MGRLRFCAPCGVKRVKDVKDQLEKLFARKKRITANECAICCHKFKILPRRAAKKKPEADTKSVCEPSEFAAQHNKTQSYEESSGIVTRKSARGAGQELEQSQAEKNMCQVNVEEHQLEGKSADKPLSEEINLDLAKSACSNDETDAGEYQLEVKSTDKPAAENSDRDSEDSVSDAQDLDYAEDDSSDSDTDQEPEIKIPSTKKKQAAAKHLDLVKSALIPKVLDLLAETDCTKQPFKCKFCEKQFAHLKRFLLHATEHPGVEYIEKAFGCKICGARWTHASYIIPHSRMHSDNRPYKCRYPPCTSAFKDKHSQAIHEQRLHVVSTMRYKCDLCTKQYKQKSELLVHRKKHGSTKPYEAKSEVDSQDSDLVEVKLHVDGKSAGKPAVKQDVDLIKSALKPQVLDLLGETDSNIKPFKCKFCEREFAHVNVFLRHAATHPGVERIEKAYICKICGTSFSRTSYIPSHARMHSDDRPFKCSYPPCTSAFKDKHSHATHEQRVHKQSAVRHKCDLCPKEYKQRDELLAHRKKHSSTKSFMCGFCGKLFTEKGYLTVHELQHSEDKPFKCSFCGKSYCQEILLRYHEMDHTGVRPYICNVCGSGFKSQVKLTLHMAIHSTEKPFKCDRCDYRSKWAKNVRQHQRVHEKECYRCSPCGKIFNNKYALNKHRKRFSDRDCGDFTTRKRRHVGNTVEAENRAVGDLVIHEGASFQKVVVKTEERVADEIQLATAIASVQ